MKWSNTVKGNDEKCNKKYKINVIYHCVCVCVSTGQPLCRDGFKRTQEVHSLDTLSAALTSPSSSSSSSGLSDLLSQCGRSPWAHRAGH